MITSLRNRHRIIVAALAFFVPTVFVSGLIIRRPVPVSSHLPEIHAGLASEQLSVVFEDKNLWKGLAMITRVVAAESDMSNMFLELKGTRNLVEPDVLVYWSETKPSPDRLPENTILLGKLSGIQVERLALPERASVIKGYLTIYSLARQKIVANAELYIPSSRSKGGSL